MIRFRYWKALLAVLFVLGLAATLMRLTAPGRASLGQGEVLMRDVLAPLQSGVTVAGQRVSGLFNGWASYRDMQAELEAVRRRVEELIDENNRLQEYRLENDRLKQLLGTIESFGDTSVLLPARVIGRDPGNWYKSLVLNVGKADGVRQDMAVITPLGLVGRVVAVTNHTSEVMTIIDPDGAVSAMVQDSRFPGVVEGVPGESGLQMIHLPHDAPVQANHVIITSGLGGLFPKGLRIGYVTEVQVQPSGLMKRALVEPFTDFDRLEEVLVILKTSGEE